MSLEMMRSGGLSVLFFLGCVLCTSKCQKKESSPDSSLLGMQQSQGVDVIEVKQLKTEQTFPETSDMVKPRAERMSVTPTSEPLEEELDDQENVISQLLGDYDKVRTISSGSDCVCRCIVRPIRRSDCSKMQDSAAGGPGRDVYTVETVTSGKDCKRCECMAPASAVNPCEGEYRFKKLQEASKDDMKLATIIDLLEGSMYGMDLLKLNSVTTKLLSRIDNLEKSFSRTRSDKFRERERLREKEKEKKSQQKKKKVSDLEKSLNKQKLLEEKPPMKNKTDSQKPLEDKTSVKDKSGLIVKGVTFYKAEDESFKERGHGTQDQNMDLLIADELIADEFPPTRSFIPSVTTKPADISPTLTRSTATTSKPAPTTNEKLTELFKNAEVPPSTTALSKTVTTTHAEGGQPIAPAPTAPQPGVKSRLIWTESPADQPKPTKKPGLCKDTVASISEPVQHNTYGLADGAWMRDARGHGSVIYLTNGHYGNTLLEFRDIDTFKSGLHSNSYELPYSFTGTGHVVLDGTFYYNRAFSRDIIRFDLRRRFVVAWTTLHDALLEEQGQRTHSEVEFAVDESGLWVLYPALDSEGFHQEVILLTQLRPRDLQPVQTFRTGLRRSRYGNSFLVCGVLYAVDNIDRRYANVTYAFDTHTLTHTVPLLAFTSAHQHTAQLSYCPLDKKLYAWDNGHQMLYDVLFAY